MLVVACGGSDTVAPTTPPADISSMKVGEVRVFKPSDIPEGLKLPSGSSARDYIVIVGNTNPTLDQKATYLVKADQSIGGSFQLSPVTETSTWPGGTLDGTRVARTAQESFETKVRAFERRALALRSPSDPLGTSRFSLRKNVRAVVLPSSLAIGNRFNVNIPNADSSNLCDSFIQTQAVIASVGIRAIIAVDTLDGPPLTLFTQAAFDSMAKEFDDVTFPTDSSYFGDPTDFDKNGHIVILFTGQINLLTKASATGGFIGGFFFAGDFFPPTGSSGQSCAESNEGEIFYLLSPDPTGKFNNVRLPSVVRQATRGTIAHEFQHMINAGRRLQNGAPEFEDVWLDEALAHFGEDAVGRKVKGFSDLQMLTLAEIVGSPGTQRDDFNAFFYQNFARLAYWMANPDTSSGISAHADANLSSRGAGWALLRYSADNFSGDDPRAFTRKLVAGPGVGINNLTSVAKVPLDTLLAGWLVAEYADHLGISGLSPRYQYRSYNMRDVMPPIAQSVFNLNIASYPLEVTSIGTGSDNITGTNQLGTATYYRLSVAANAPAKIVKVLDPRGTLATFPGAHIYVLRVQ
jgi:hypothetical protein